VVAGAPTAAAGDPRGVRVTGSASGRLDPLGEFWAGHQVRFTVDGRVSGQGQPTGRFHVDHRTPDGGPFAEFEGRVDCVLASDGQGVVTGIIERAETPGLPPEADLVGRRVGISVADRPGRDKLGWSWIAGGFDKDTLPCTSAPPFLKVDSGGYRVTGSSIG